MSRTFGLRFQSMSLIVYDLARLQRFIVPVDLYKAQWKKQTIWRTRLKMDIYASVDHINGQDSRPNSPFNREEGTKIIFTLIIG